MTEPRFLADDNVGRLARWLRVLGYDTLYLKGLQDEELIAVAAREGRVLLTRDRQLVRRRLAAARGARTFLVGPEDLEGQLRQVAEAFGLDKGQRPFSRCLECNLPLVDREKDEVRGRVPPYVFQTQGQFRECPGCHRLYWRGTHWGHMMKKVDSLTRLGGGGEA
ncbi:MAG: Mut7-C RNAse domain-containing protein [Chloroflexi bacterium]|nr:Mut7-C RNAse domain-containing protein [Chloroflexota bacterium]